MGVPGIPPGGGGPNPTDPVTGLPMVVPQPSPSDAAWVKFAQQMFPDDPDAAMYITQLKQNMMQMIGSTIAEINTRQQIANEYNEKVAKGEE